MGIKTTIANALDNVSDRHCLKIRDSLRAHIISSEDSYSLNGSMRFCGKVNGFGKSHQESQNHKRKHKTFVRL